MRTAWPYSNGSLCFVALSEYEDAMTLKEYGKLSLSERIEMGAMALTGLAIAMQKENGTVGETPTPQAVRVDPSKPAAE